MSTNARLLEKSSYGNFVIFENLTCTWVTWLAIRKLSGNSLKCITLIYCNFMRPTEPLSSFRRNNLGSFPGVDYWANTEKFLSRLKELGALHRVIETRTSIKLYNITAQIYIPLFQNDEVYEWKATRFSLACPQFWQIYSRYLVPNPCRYHCQCFQIRWLKNRTKQGDTLGKVPG